jgi:hypothetical protein
MTTLKQHIEAILEEPKVSNGCLCGDCTVIRIQKHAEAALAILNFKPLEELEDE